MPEGNVFLGIIAVVEVLAEVLAVIGSSLASSFGRRWIHRRIIATAHQTLQMLYSERIKRRLAVLKECVSRLKPSWI
jgi:hypothetical protein